MLVAICQISRNSILHCVAYLSHELLVRYQYTPTLTILQNLLCVVHRETDKEGFEIKRYLNILETLTRTNNILENKDLPKHVCTKPYKGYRYRAPRKRTGKVNV